MGKDELPTYEEVIQEKEKQDNSRINNWSAAIVRPSNVGGDLAAQNIPELPPRPGGGGFGRPPLPWNYPARYYCPKCANTGYKLKNSRQCRDCWRLFAKNHTNVHFSRPVYSQSASSGFGSSLFHALSPIQITYGPYNLGPQNSPIVVQPGDPLIGGYQCAECRGTGSIRFLLDKEPCRTCHGLGRIF